MPGTITVHVQLHTILQYQTPDGPVRRLDISLPSGSTLGVLVERLKVVLPVDALLLAVNGRTADLETTLSDGDAVNLMPAISGG